MGEPFVPGKGFIDGLKTLGVTEFHCARPLFAFAGLYSSSTLDRSI